MNHTKHTKQERLMTIENLEISYGPKVILCDVNLHVDNIVRPGMSQGQTVALLGPSGVGKTQLFKAIAGLLVPTTCGVLINQPHSVASTPSSGGSHKRLNLGQRK